MTPWEKFCSNFKDKKVLVMGLGIQGGGVEVARTLVEAGAQVTVTDLRDKSVLQPSLDSLVGLKVKYTLGEHKEADFKNADIVIRNPSVPESSPFLDIARKHHIPIKMEASLFAKYTTSILIGITGTRGKSTTAHLLTHILSHAGKKPLLAGNVPGKAALPLLKTATPDHLVILELSSWQLQGFAEEKISPHIAVITSIYPDHLNRYQSMTEYIQDKTYIFRFQKSIDYTILNRDNVELTVLASQVPSQLVWFTHQDLPTNLSLKIPGIHNRENAAAAMAVSKILDIPQDKILAAISSFTGIPYRLETIGNINGVTIINDTTSTTPVATIKAIQSINSSITLILGGETKNLPTKELAAEINGHVSKVVLLSGSGTEEVKSQILPDLIVGETRDLKQALTLALKHSGPNSTLLFSPGFTSFGLFLNEFNRGEAFNHLIEQKAHEKS